MSEQDFSRRRRRYRAGGVLALVLATSSGGCSESPALRAAERGDLPTLRREVEAGEHAATLSLAETARLARAVAFRDVTQASRQDRVARVRDVRACAIELDDALSFAMKTMDAAGAEAAAERLEGGELSESDARSFAASPDDDWRAVGTRGLTRPRDAEARRKALLDPSPAVRRSALRALRGAYDAQDFPVVFEAARLDPDPMVRTDAVRLIALLGRSGRDVAQRLADLYPHADDAVREDIGAAWAAPGVFEHGGREALRVRLASDEGPGGISAAAAVLREGLADAETLAAARTELARAIASGPRRNRMHAIAVAPYTASTPDLLTALEEAGHDEDPEVRISALGRLSSSEAPARDRADAMAQLEALAAKKGGARVASRALGLLASAGDVRVQAWVEEDLRSEDPSARLAAVGALVSLGRASRAAPILADADPSVRDRGACALLVAARVGPALR